MKFAHKAAIFDMDGTLIDSMKGWRRVKDRFIEHFHIDDPRTMRQEVAGMSLEESAVYMIRKSGLAITREECVAFFESVILENYRGDTTVFPDTIPFLEHLRAYDIPMCIATATPRHLADIPLTRFDLAGFFPFVITDAEVPGGKRRPEIFLRCAEHFALAPSDIMVFEDSAYAAQTAKEAGFAVCGMLTGTSDDQLPPYCDLLIGGFRELM